MSGMNHPPIHFELQPEVTLQQEFAELATELLRCYNVPDIQVDGDYQIHYPSTSPIAIETDEETETYLRLQRRASTEHALPTGAVADAHIVLEMQAGTLDEEDESYGEAIDWQPYVQVVIDKSQPDEPAIIDAETGYELELADLFQAKAALDLLARELRGDCFADSCQFDSLPAIERQPRRPTYDTEFTPADADLNHYCSQCQAANTICQHNAGWQN